MSTTDRITYSRWWLPAVSLALGAIMFAAFAIGGVAYIVALIAGRLRG